MDHPELAETDATLRLIVRRAHALGRSEALRRVVDVLRDKRRELINDALIFLTAREAGAILISANVSDMDLLLRFRPDTHVLLYRQTATA